MNLTRYLTYNVQSKKFLKVAYYLLEEKLLRPFIDNLSSASYLFNTFFLLQSDPKFNVFTLVTKLLY